MKTAYCVLGITNCGVIKFSDKLLDRIEELKHVVRDNEESLEHGFGWGESISVTISYGGMKWEKDPEGVDYLVPSAKGPVLAYGHHNYPDMRCVDESVTILVGSDDAYVESYWEEGSENPLGYGRVTEGGYRTDYTIGTIPDVHFSDGFLHHWCEHIRKHHLGVNREVVQVVEDMPQEHRCALDIAVEKYLKTFGDMFDHRKKIEQGVLHESCDRFVLDERMKSKFKEPVKIGLDFHGVIDDDPKYFAGLAQRILNDGGEVHILTGSKDTETLREKLAGFGVKYTALFSISTHHQTLGTKVWEDEHGPWMDGEVWDKSKAEYCKEHGINLHFDDSGVYGKHFATDTTYVRYPDMEVVNKPL